MKDYEKAINLHDASDHDEISPTIWILMPNQAIKYVIITDGDWRNLDAMIYDISDKIGALDVAVDAWVVTQSEFREGIDLLYVMTVEQFNEWLEKPAVNEKGEVSNAQCPDCGGPG